MSKFNKALLGQIKDSLFTKEAFIPSPQMQQQIVEAQNAGAVPPDPAQQQAGADGGSQVGLEQLAQMMQTGFDGLNQGLQQLAQMIQQSAAQAPAGGEKEKKLSTTERIDRLEQMLQQAMGGGGEAPPQDPAAAAPPQDPAAQAAPPQDPAAGAPPAQ